MAAPPDALGDLAASLQRLDGLLTVAAPVGKVFRVVPGEVLGAPCEEDLVQDVAGLVGDFVLVVKVVDADLVVGGPDVGQLEFVEFLALVDGGDFDFVRVLLLICGGGGG